MTKDSFKAQGKSEWSRKDRKAQVGPARKALKRELDDLVEEAGEEEEGQFQRGQEESLEEFAERAREHGIDPMDPEFNWEAAALERQLGKRNLEDQQHDDGRIVGGEEVDGEDLAEIGRAAPKVRREFEAGLGADLSGLRGDEQEPDETAEKVMDEAALRKLGERWDVKVVRTFESPARAMAYLRKAFDNEPHGEEILESLDARLGGHGDLTREGGVLYRIAREGERFVARVEVHKERVAIVGSRGWLNLEQVRAYVRSLPENAVIVSGAARGVDSAAEEEARKTGRRVQSFPADWDRLGKRAGYERNKDIIGAADRVVAFWDGTSRGTQHSINLAREAKKPVEVITPVKAKDLFEIVGGVMRFKEKLEAQVEQGLIHEAQARQMLGEPQAKRVKPQVAKEEDNMAETAKQAERVENFPEFGVAPGAAISGAKASDLAFYAARARQTLADTAKRHFHEKEERLLTAILEEQRKQNLIPDRPTAFPKFGPAPEAPIAGAEAKTLEFYAACARKTLADPAEIRHHGRDQALLEAIKAEQGLSKTVTPAKAPEMPEVFPQFGPAAGKPIAGALRQHLEFYEGVAKKNLADAAKEKFHAKDRVLLAAVRGEMANDKRASQIGKPVEKGEKDGAAKFPNFGKAAGKPIAGADWKDLKFYASCAQKTIADPAKAKFHEKEKALLAAIEAEQKAQWKSRQSDAGKDGAEKKPAEPPTKFRNFGKWAGQPIAGAPREALEYYINASEKNLGDANKAKFHAAEKVLLEVLRNELKSEKRVSKAGKVAAKEEVTDKIALREKRQSKEMRPDGNGKTEKSRVSAEIMPGMPDNATKAPRTSAKAAEERMKAAVKGRPAKRKAAGAEEMER